MEKFKKTINSIEEENIPSVLQGQYKLFVFVLSENEKIVTRGRTETEAREVCMADQQTLDSMKGRGYFIQDVDLLPLKEQKQIKDQYSNTHPFDWEKIPPRVLLEKHKILSRNN